MTATPHNGKEEDFQLFLALLDGDRFEGRFRDGTHLVDTSDLMRRLVKEDLLKFDGRPLFPERIAHTVQYDLSDLEAILYRQVTEYVREEFNRAEALANDDRKGTVGFALTILQRRLASSPEAIFQSLRRRRERLEQRLREAEIAQRGLTAELEFGTVIDVEDWDDDFEDAPSQEREATEETVVDQASAARTIQELKLEIQKLRQLEHLAAKVRRSGTDRKWDELSKLLQHQAEMFDSSGQRRKLVIFTEHRDTLNYLADRIRTVLGQTESVVVIHGGLGREERKKAEAAFKQDVMVQVLLATDAAGEGINLQRAHLMVNYDLPWNPNRLEQRFGRIHRIGQTEVCHLWNLVAHSTREGDVYLSLLRKLEIEQRALGGKVFDVLGQALVGRELRELLIEAIRYGEREEVKAKLKQIMSDRLDQARLRQLIEERALSQDTMDVAKVQQIRQDMERIEALKLQPHFIAEFFLKAFEQLGGNIRQRERHRYEITHVPAVIRHRDRVIGLKEPILQRYERICFEKDLISVSGKPPATFVCPGHPLLDATLDIILERYQSLLRQGAILVDEQDYGETVRVLVYLEHSIQDARTQLAGRRRVVSRRMQYVEIDMNGSPRPGGVAPYLDYRPLTEREKELTPQILNQLGERDEIEQQAMSYAIQHLLPQHLQEVQEPKVALINKTIAAVRDRLTREIRYWDSQAIRLKQEEAAGKVNARLNSARAQQRADELASRLERRLAELEQERQLSPLPPVIVGGALIVPIGWLQQLMGQASPDPGLFAKETKEVELAAMAAVMQAETALGHKPRDVSQENRGYDIESYVPETGRLRFIEVKGRIAGAETVFITRNEIKVAMNKPENYVLALVEVPPQEMGDMGISQRAAEGTGQYGVGAAPQKIRYVQQAFEGTLGWDDVGLVKNWKKLWERGQEPG